MPNEPAIERADAARNRRAILDAAARLLADRGAENVSIEQIAAAAGVGKGTVFHRFGSRAGLLRALVWERADSLRTAVTAGPPPLGPGAPADERIRAYFGAMADLVAANAELVAAYGAETDDPRTEEIHAFWFGHIAGLLTEIRPDLDTELVGQLLLGTLGGQLALHLVRTGQSDRLRSAVLTIVEAVVAASANAD